MQEDFIHRHIGTSQTEQKFILDYLQYESLSKFLADTVPHNILQNNSNLDLPPCTENEALSYLQDLLSTNQIYKTYIGQGYYSSFLPSVIQRNILENPSWYTSYTPYQPEIAQGRLEALLNYQQMVMDLTGMDVANASLLDEATAAAEAMTLAFRQTKLKSKIFFVDSAVHPQTLELLRTRSKPLGINLLIGYPDAISIDDCFGFLLQYPNTNGEIFNWTNLIKEQQNKGCIICVATDLLALTMLKPPGEFGADIVFGSSQRFGVPMGYGGPHAAFFAVKDKFKRSLPGRLIGVSKDTKGKIAYRLSLQTREQHIRREKATSNICTAQVLLAVIAGFYAVYHGETGLKKIGERVYNFTKLLYSELTKNNFKCNNSFFDTLCVEVKYEKNDILTKANAAKINLRILNDNYLGISLDETTTLQDVVDLLALFDIVDPKIDNQILPDNLERCGIPIELKRHSNFLQHPVYQKYRSETELMRYMYQLEKKDIALNTSMIALGSCTMKLNSATEMTPVTWPKIGNLHPFVPIEQAKGIQEMMKQLEKWLLDLTGYDVLSMQPNSGAQGEYAGLLTIMNYHISNGQSQRNICLIPSSAHGTNPASAQMCGMKVEVVNCDKNGNVDLIDLANKIEKNAGKVSALMVTYPSTHGVFEEQIENICTMVQEEGGQVYMDGANLNALIGIAQPAKFGPDIMHFNLHKTFCIPHGGGGPGMGPIGAKKHLEKHLPNHKVIKINDTYTGGAVSAAPWGSPSILPISWMYIKMMGGNYLRQASVISILHANYIAERLSVYYKILYRGKNNRLAHECIIDIRPIKNEVGITEEDIAKRLMDFGYHAPTMSWPVAGTLMIEPTESESLKELDQFCDAMLQISKEIELVRSGHYSLTNNPLVNAPHTQDDIVNEPWLNAYTREQAVFPLPWIKNSKYWPSVNRIDNVYGDRNLVCSCPNIESYR